MDKVDQGGRSGTTHAGMLGSPWCEYIKTDRRIYSFFFLTLKVLLQASAAFPENTIASFERAIRDGSEGLESG